ncbi:predicted protein [Naegleria gruberi]|uniref:Predicted protein n=1 Tax=Naegleria gruberi TaxID=5762 RepID=D2W416_NAEGR|nr:uncharacterized protein NAEGRDRAFT_76146 [Naegleria gruberi]EFC36167.1 predicted protein [Naegleria gruberi]|eukprot:XP_002668911.1 predicted protein [Naegleria gruberi strain NEG-M]
MYTIRELEMMYNSSSNRYNLLYGIPIYYERRDGGPITALKSVIALFNNTLGFKAFLVVDPYNVPYSTDIPNVGTTLPPLFNETIYGSDFYIRKLLDWQGTDPNVTPQCSYLVNYNLDKSKAEYYNDLFYCDSSALNGTSHVFTLSSSSKKIISKYDGNCLQFVYKTDSTTKTTVVFQFQTCANTKLQEFGFNGQYFSIYGDSKVMYVADKITSSSGSVYSAPGAMDIGAFSELTFYGRNPNYPYRAYQFYLEPINGYPETMTISNKGPYVYPPLSFTNQTYIDLLNSDLNTTLSTYLRTSVVNRLYTEYQKQKRLPFPVPPDELLYTYIFLPIAIFFGGFLFMFISVACCWTGVYIKKTYCKP